MTDVPLSLVDLQLVKRAMIDPRDEEKLLVRLYPKIQQIVRATMNNQSSVDDIVQLAALEILKSLKWYKGLGSIEAFAAKITYRTATKAIKRAKRRGVTQMPLYDDELVTEETPETQMKHREVFDALLEKLSVIPEKRRVPLLLHLAYGYTVREVAEMTDSPANTVKDRLKTALREFRSVMKEHPELMTTILEEVS